MIDYTIPHPSNQPPQLISRAHFSLFLLNGWIFFSSSIFFQKNKKKKGRKGKKDKDLTVDR